MSEQKILTASDLNDFSAPANKKGAENITSILKEANSFVSNLRGLFVLGEQFRKTSEGETPQGVNAGAKYEKGVEAGMKMKAPVEVVLEVNKEGATEKLKNFIDTLMSNGDESKTVKEVKEELKAQFEGDDKELLQNMVEDFIRSYATARIK